jgi:hypothetical protein
MSLALLGLFVTACDESAGPAEIWIDVSPVDVGPRVVADDVSPLHFDLQLYNGGGDVLSISSVNYRGDVNCAFTFEGPDRTELGPEESAFIRGWYKPEVVDLDHIAMDVVSNADNYPLLVVPICGKGIEPGTMAVRPYECVVPEPDQPDCPSGN